MNTIWNRNALPKQTPLIALLAVLPLATLGVRSLSAPAKPHGAGHAAKAADKSVVTPPAAQAPVRMRLAAARLRPTRDAQGAEKNVWQPLAADAPVQSGDTLRYTLRIENPGPKPVRDFVATQPIPPALAYVPASAGAPGADGMQVTFRVDGESGYSAEPTVADPQADGTVKRVPAPAGAYRAIRWSLTGPLAPGQPVQGVFDEKVL